MFTFDCAEQVESRRKGNGIWSVLLDYRCEIRDLFTKAMTFNCFDVDYPLSILHDLPPSQTRYEDSKYCLCLREHYPRH